MTYRDKGVMGDPLLAAGKILTIILQALTGLAAIVIALVIPAFLIFRDEIVAEASVELNGAQVIEFPVFETVGILAIALLAIVAIFFFFDRLRRMIGTVADGDPFVPGNATRLTEMAWLLLGVQLLTFPAAFLASALVRWSETVEGADFSLDMDLDLTAILMILVLFILARVFRHGAAMREDLEGTV